MKIRCTECNSKHELEDCQTKDFFNGGTSYYCPDGDDDSMEIARRRGDRVVYWNGREFELVKVDE